jgi:hypothetical protein
MGSSGPSEVEFINRLWTFTSMRNFGTVDMALLEEDVMNPKESGDRTHRAP